MYQQINIDQSFISYNKSLIDGIIYHLHDNVYTVSLYPQVKYVLNESLNESHIRWSIAEFSHMVINVFPSNLNL